MSEPARPERADAAHRLTIRAAQDAAEVLGKRHQLHDPRAREPGLLLPRAFTRAVIDRDVDAVLEVTNPSQDARSRDFADFDLAAAIAMAAGGGPRRAISLEVQELVTGFEGKATTVKAWQRRLHPAQRPVERGELRPVRGDLAEPRWTQSEAGRLERRVRRVCDVAAHVEAGELPIRPATLGAVLRRCRRDGVPLKTYLVVSWLAAHRGDATIEDIDVGAVSEVIGLPDEVRTRRRVRAALAALDELRLVSVATKPPAPPDVTWLHLAKWNSPSAASLGMMEVLPAGLFTRGWCARLSAPALAAALVLADQHQPSDADLEPMGVVYPEAAGVSPASWYRGIAELSELGLVEQEPAPINPRTGTNAFRRSRYRLLKHRFSGSTAPNPVRRTGS